MSKVIEFIKKTPKAELHLHIEGTLEPDLLFRLAKKNNIQIPFSNVDEIKSAYNFKNLESFLNIFSGIFKNSLSLIIYFFTIE